MAWPDNLLNVKCIGFDRPLLPTIVEAIKNKQVAWHPDLANGFGEYVSSYFDFERGRYRLDEFNEVVISVERLGPIAIGCGEQPLTKSADSGSW